MTPTLTNEQAIAAARGWGDAPPALVDPIITNEQAIAAARGIDLTNPGQTERIPTTAEVLADAQGFELLAPPADPVEQLDAGQLGRLTRAKLDAIATGLGLDPADYANKPSVVAAIMDAAP